MPRRCWLWACFPVAVLAACTSDSQSRQAAPSPGSSIRSARATATTDASPLVSATTTGASARSATSSAAASRTSVSAGSQPQPSAAHASANASPAPGPDSIFSAPAFLQISRGAAGNIHETGAHASPNDYAPESLSTRWDAQQNTWSFATVGGADNALVSRFNVVFDGDPGLRTLSGLQISIPFDADTTASLNTSLVAPARFAALAIGQKGTTLNAHGNALTISRIGTNSWRLAMSEGSSPFDLTLDLRTTADNHLDRVQIKVHGTAVSTSYDGSISSMSK